MKAPDVAILNSELVVARDELARLTSVAEALSTPQHWTETDPAVVSGIRRKPNARAGARRFAKFDREAEAWEAVRAKEAEVALLERRIAAAKQNTRIPFTGEALRSARYVRDRHGWYEVVRVNAKSVTVSTPWSTDRVALVDVLEVRP